MAHDRCTQPRDRPRPARHHRRVETPGGNRALVGRRPVPTRRQRGRRRPPATDLHVLPPGPLDRRAGRADPANPRGAHHDRDQPRVPGAGTDDGAAARASEAQDPQRGDPLPRPARPISCPSAPAQCSRCSISSSTRATPRHRAPTSCAGACARRPSASAARSPRSCPTSPKRSGCSRSCCCTTRGGSRASTSRATSCCSTRRIAASGTSRRSTRRSTCSSGRCAAGNRARIKCRPRSRRATRLRATRPTPTGSRSPASTPSSRSSRRHRLWS